MYSRYGDNDKRPIRLPEHYGGSAFSQRSTAQPPIPKKEPVRSFPRDGVGEKASPVADRLLRSETAAERKIELPPEPSIPDIPSHPEEAIEEKEEKTPTPPIEKKPTTSPINFEGLRRLLGGENDGDKDRLLLLGLILLLSRTEGESDILLWLSLLLLCG